MVVFTLVLGMSSETFLKNLVVLSILNMVKVIDMIGN